MRTQLDRHIRQWDHTDFGRLAWIQSDKSSSAWVTTCHKEHNKLTDRQFPVVAQTYFGVGQQCLVGLVRLHIRQKTRRGKEFRETECDAFGENLVQATLPRARWALHHDAINLQVHRIAKQSGKGSSMEVEDLFIRRLSESTIILDNNMHLLITHLKGYVPDGRQTGIANSKHPAGVGQFTKVKVIHNGIVQYIKPDVRNIPIRSAAVQKFQGHVKKTYLVNLHKKDREHFGTTEGTVGPLETICMQLDLKSLVFGTFAEISNNVKDFIETAVEYEVEHLGRTMAATTVDA